MAKYHHPSLDASITLNYDLSKTHPTQSESEAHAERYTISYSLHLPLLPSNPSDALPLLILCHPFNNSRAYWTPQLLDPLLSRFSILTIDAVGFGASRTYGRRWTFDLAASSVLEILDQLDREPPEGFERGCKGVLVGDSMGGGPTGIRVALRDAERVKEEMRESRILGVVVCGSAAEVESQDFVEEYTAAASSFSASCVSSGLPSSISTLAHSMSLSGYTTSFPSALSFGESVIENAVALTLSNEDGTPMSAEDAGKTMEMNYACLNHRLGLIEKLERRPSSLGKRQILVIHGEADNAYPLERGYHQHTFDSIGEQNAEMYIVKGGPHFVTVTHVEEVDRVIVDWIKRKFQ